MLEVPKTFWDKAEITFHLYSVIQLESCAIATYKGMAKKYIRNFEATCTNFTYDKLCNLPQHGWKFETEERIGNRMNGSVPKGQDF